MRLTRARKAAGPGPAGQPRAADAVTPDGAPDELAAVLGRLAESDLDQGERQRLLARLAALLSRSARSAGAGAVASGRWLGDLLIEAGPHIPVRTLDTLRQHHHGLAGEALADALVRNAAYATTGIGAAAGTVAAAQWIVAPVLVAVPLEIMVETLAVAVVEVKLLAELHAVYQVAVPGTGTQRGLAFVVAWAQRRGVNPLRPWAISAAMSAAARASVSRRMMGRFARNLGGLAPMMIGALYGARSNRGQTRMLADSVRRDLRARGALNAPSAP